MLNQPPITPEPEDETLVSLRDSLREAQRRLAYYERFGPLLEEQMSTVVAKAAEVARESEHDKAEVEREVTRLRQEAEALRAECDWQRAEASAIITQAHHDAASILSRARGEVSTIVSAALEQLEHAQKDILQSERPAIIQVESTPFTTLAPPEPTHAPWNPVIEVADAEPEVAASEAADGEAAGDEDDETSSDRVVEMVPAEAAPEAPSTESAPEDAVVTYLTVRSHLTHESLPQFGRSLEELPGVRGTAVARVGDDSVELVVAHHRDTDLLARMRSIPGLEFRLVARGEGQVEIEILERNAPPLRA